MSEPREPTTSAGSWPSVPPAESTEPTEPTEPSQPNEPEPTQPPAPAEPAEPVEPAESTQPTAPTEPLEPPQPTEPLEPPQPTEPQEPEPTRLPPEPLAEADAAVTTESTRSWLTVAAVIAVVLALASSALLAVVAQHNANRNAVTAARSEALAAARAETAATLTYDYRHLDADFAAAEKGLTPKFRAGYAQTTASSVVPLAQKTHAVSTATIAASGVISATASSAKILVYADQTVQNNLLKTTSRLDRSVIEVSMVKQSGRWLIDNLQPF